MTAEITHLEVYYVNSAQGWATAQVNGLQAVISVNMHPTKADALDHARRLREDVPTLIYDKSGRLKKTVYPKTFDFVTKYATSSDQMETVADKVRFHYFNPNGIVAEKLRFNEKIDCAVENGIFKSGAIFAYGALNTYHEDAIAKLLQNKRPREWTLNYHIGQLQQLFQRVEERLQEEEVT